MPNRSLRSLQNAPSQTEDGNSDRTVHNAILLALPPEQLQAILPKLEFLPIPTHFVLNEMAEPIQYVFFVNSGLASILNVMANGKSVEVGLAGAEGFVGLPLIVGFRTSPTHVVMQIAGSAFRLRTQDLKGVLQRCPQLEKRLHRYSQEFALQVTQVATCNRLHEVDQRLARWLLMSHDRVAGSGFSLTQEFLSNMLGTRRASVTVAAGMLQKRGLITYRRGYVQIKNRARLEAAACECYGILNRQMKSWRADVNHDGSESPRVR